MQVKPFLLRACAVLVFGLGIAGTAAADDNPKICKVTYINSSQQTAFGVSVELLEGDRFLFDNYQVDQATIGSSYGPKNLRPGKTVTLELVGTQSCKMETTLTNGSDYHTSLVSATGSNHDKECGKTSTNDFMKNYGCDCTGSGSNHDTELTITCTGSSS